MTSRKGGPMQCRRNGRSCLTVPAVIAITALLLAACDPNGIPLGTVRLQGAFDNLVPAETIVEARASERNGSRALLPGALNPRSLISQSASISAILAGANTGNLDEPGVVTTTEVSEEGSFALDVPTAAAPDGASGDYVMLAYDESLGVGVEQLIGFIELPAGADESSAGWPLGGTTQGTTVDLGIMGGDGGVEQSIVASSDQNELYELLGADQAAVLFQAQRDNFLKQAQNDFLNPDVPFGVLYIHTLPRENVPVNAWEDQSTLSRLDAPNVTIMFQNIERSLFEGIRDGSRPFEITAPSEVTPRVDGATPTNTITFEELDFPDDNPAFSLVIDLEYISGIWDVYLDDQQIAAYDWGLTLPIDENGDLLAYVPALFIEANETSGRIETITLRWYAFDNASGEYRVVDVESSEDLPFAEGFSFTLRSFGVLEEEIDLIVGEPVAVVPEFYTPTAAQSDGSNELVGASVGYTIGGVVILTDLYLEEP